MSTSPKLTLAQWRTAVEGAAGEIATYALSLPGVVVHDPVGLECASAMIGAHIPLIGGGQAFDLALVASGDGCQALSRAILGASPGAPLRDAEVADAVGEIVNMLAGSSDGRPGRRARARPTAVPPRLHPANRSAVGGGASDAVRNDRDDGVDRRPTRLTG